MSNPSVSVVVPVYNSERVIGQTITALKAQDYPFVEIIIVDDGSTDSSASIIKSFPKVKYFYQNNQGPAVARNLGVENALGEIIFFTDSDCVPEADWIKKMVLCFKDSSTAAVCGSYNIANSGSILAQCIQDEIVYRHYHLMPTHPKSFGSYNVAIRKNVFDEVGGFNKEFRNASGEDNELSYKILKSGGVIVFEREAKVAHYHTEALMKYLKEQFRHGFWRVKIYLKHPNMMQGDDYTFWKDILEVPLVGVTVLIFALFAFGVLSERELGLLLFIWILLEGSFAFKMMSSLKHAFYFTIVTILRAFARTFGFILGALFSLRHIRRK